MAAEPRGIRERRSTVESWLRGEVAAAHDALKADPARAIAAEDVFAELRRRHAERLAPGAGLRDR